MPLAISNKGIVGEESICVRRKGDVMELIRNGSEEES